MNDFLVVEDHTLMLKGIIRIIEERSDFKCLDSAAGYEVALKMFERQSERILQRPIPCIVDLNLGNDSGLELVKHALEKYANIKFIVYSMYKSPGIVNQAMEAGAAAYISKNAAEEELFQAIVSVSNGKNYIEKNLSGGLYVFKSAIVALTNRERQVFDLILENKSNEEIAKIMNIGKRAVENYTSRIYAKMDVNDRSELIKKYGN